VSGNTIGAFESRARWVVDGAFFSAEAAISMEDDDANGGERDDGRAVVGGDATRDAREGTRDKRVFFVCVFRSFGRSSRGRGSRWRRARRFGGDRARSHASRPSAGNAMMGTMTRAMDDDEDDED